MKTKKWAKELSLEVWVYLRDHSGLRSKSDLPFYEKIINITNECPLCHIFWRYGGCKGCPLECLNDDEKLSSSSLYYQWHNAHIGEDRAKYAGLIYDKIAAWDIDND